MIPVISSASPATEQQEISVRMHRAGSALSPVARSHVLVAPGSVLP